MIATAPLRRTLLLSLVALLVLLVAAVPRAGAVLTVTQGSDRNPEADRIVVTEDDGSNPRVLGPGIRSAVSPDGSLVAVTDLGEGVASLALYRIDGERLWDLRHTELAVVEWSPDSKQLVGAETEARRLVLIDVETGEVTPIGGATGQITGESFSPDSTELAYTTRTSERTPGGRLRVVDLATGATRTLRAGAEDPVWGTAGIAFSTISRAKRQIHSIGNSVWNVARINPDGSAYRQLTQVKPDERFFGLTPVGWSRDGTRIASGVMGADGEWLNTWVVDAVHGGAKLLAGRVEATAVSSDGRYVIGQTGDPECCGFRYTDIVRLPWTPTRGKPHVLVHHAMLASSSVNANLTPEPLATVALPAPRGTAAAAAKFGLARASTARAAAADKSCGRVSSYEVTVIRGSVSCQKARSVIKAYNSGKGTLHKRGPGRENWVTTLPGGWSCVSGAGGEEECMRGPKVNEYEYEDMVGASSN